MSLCHEGPWEGQWVIGTYHTWVLQFWAPPGFPSFFSSLHLWESAYLLTTTSISAQIFLKKNYSPVL